MSNDVVSVHGLRKAYGGTVVVDDLDLTVPAGQIVGLTGANGAGKTTTVECIQGLRRPDAGQIRVLGYDPATQATALRPLIGSQLQDCGLPDRMRVGEAVALFRSSPGTRLPGAGLPGADLPGADLPDTDLIAQFGLGGRRRSAFATLSGGERQRLFLVLALLNRPRLVILDELTQNLDPAARRSVWAAIRQLNADGTTVLLVTHEMEEAEALCDQVIVLRAGRVLDSGAPAELINRHAAAGCRLAFSLPGCAPPALLDRLRLLPGVGSVSRSGCRVEVRCSRPGIAHVSAAMLGWDQVPDDLSVSVPTLEDALLGLLRDEHDEHDELVPA